MGVLTRPGVTEHLEGLLVDGLLLVHPHHYRELAFRDAVTRGSLRNVPRGRASWKSSAHHGRLCGSPSR